MDGESELLPSTSKIELSTENELPFCSACSKQFPTKESFDKHYERNHSEKKLVCDNCNKAFSSKFLFEKHSKKCTCKMKYRKSSCEDCGSKLVYLRKHTGDKSLECDTCKRSFFYNSTLHQETGDKKYVCHICKRCFLKKVYLKRHLRTHTGERPYTCEVCFKCFVTRAALNIHRLTHTGEKPYTCDICYKRFRHVGTLKYHSFFVHSGPDCPKLHFCDRCGISFRERKSLLRHELRHKKALKTNLTHIKSSLVNSTQDSVKLACGSNDGQFKHEDYLKAQDDAHPEHKPYVCHICQQCFSDEESFQKHSNTHTNKVIPVISSYSCDMNSSREKLQQDYLSNVEEKLICDICDEQFDNSDSLKTHFKTHSEQKYYVCEVCQLCFIDEDALRNHENIEKCVYFHTCKICGEKFVAKIELETHCRTHVGFANETNFSNSFDKPSDLDQQYTMPSITNIKSNVDDNRTEKVYSHDKGLPYNCELCNKNFTDENDLKQHNILHTEKKSHVCVLCLKNFDHKVDLDAHVCKYDNKEKKSILFQALQGNQLKGYICSICLKCFMHHHAFQHHMFEHDKEHGCKICDKRFYTADSLKAHLLQSHKPPMHPCIVCKEKFLNKNDLIAHCFSHLGSGEYFICGSCKQCFKGREDLQKHSPCFVKTGTT